MFMHLQPASAASQTIANALAADLACYAGMVRELAEMGMDVARELHRRAVAPEADAEIAEADESGGARAGGRVEAASRAFDQAARGVRRTILLAHTISKPAAKAPDEWSRSMARRYIIRSLEDEIHSGVGDETRREALTAELHERLDGPDVAEDLDDRPIEYIVREIRRDLGIEPIAGSNRYKRRTPDDIAALCARAMEPCSTQPSTTQPSATKPGGASPGAMWPGNGVARAASGGMPGQPRPGGGHRGEAADKGEVGAKPRLSPLKV